METKKLYYMDKVIDLAMSKLFHLAEHVCSKCSFVVDEPAVSQEIAPTIRFTNEKDAAIKRVKSDVSISSFEREQSRLKIKMVEGELFK